MANVNFFSPDGGTTRYPLEDTEGRTTYEEEIHGVNLLKVTASTQTINGVTFTVNNDGTITVNGTASANAILDLFSMTKEQYYKAFGERDLILNGCPSGGDPSGHSVDWSKYHLGIIETQNTVNSALTDGGNGVTIPASWFASATNNINLRIRVASGQTVSNLVFKPMIRKADIDDPTYRPYNHQAIQNQLNAQGVLGAKNWFKFPYAGTSATINGIVYTVNNDGTVLANGTATEDANFAIARLTRGDFDNLVNKKYIMSGCPVGGNTTTYRLTWYQNKDGVQNWVHDVGESVEIDFTGANTYNIISVDVIVKKGTTVNNLVFKPMLRLASDPDDTYQPYAMANRELTEKVFEKRVLTSADDLNDITETGIYKIRTAPVNSPESVAYVTLIVCKYDASDIDQMICRGGSSSGNIYVRSKGGSPSAWLPWYKFTGTVVS